MGLSLAFWALALVGAVSPAAGEFRIAPEGFAVRMLDADGNPEQRAGSHPDRVQIDLKFETEGSGESAGDIVVEMPAGFGGDPSAVPVCPRQAHEEGEECSPESQVGIVSFGSGSPLPIYLLEPGPNQLAAFTSKTGLAIPFELKLRPEDFGANIVAEELPAGAPDEAHMELWGIPADHQEGGPSAARRPFLTAPSVCGPLTFALRARSREAGAPWQEAGADTLPLVGCESLPFAPRLDLRLSNPVADSPTGARLAMSMPQSETGELGNAQVRDVSIEMPPGVTVSPSGAAALVTCADAQFGLDDESDAACPAASRIGTVQMTSASLSEPIEGSIYLGEQRGRARVRLLVVAHGFGAVLKFVSSLNPDTQTGAMTATLRDLPPVAFEEIAMSLSGGARGLLATPLSCGPTSGVATFVPYGGGAAVTSVSTVTLAAALPGLACSGPLFFAPELSVFAASQRAAKPTYLSTAIRRRSGEALPARLAVTLPDGFSAALGSVESCPDPAAAVGACPAPSRVGSVRAAVGSGPEPAILTGAVFLAGPYRRAPFSLVMSFPGALGPFDFGAMAVRAKVLIDGRSGEVTISTDRLPDAIEGLPVRFQTIELSLDRPGLVRNPTSCRPHALDVEIESREGEVAELSSPLRVRGCAKLGFRPRVRAALVGDGPLRSNQAVRLLVSARFRPHDAALRSLALSLPPAVKLRVGKLEEICSQIDARRGACPPGSMIGTTRARTPLLDQAMSGSIHIAQPRGEGQPDIWIQLAGDNLDLAMRGTTANRDGRFLTRLADLPDMPLSSLTMRLGAGEDDLFSLTGSPCVDGAPRRLRADMRIVGQNGVRRRSRLPIAIRTRCRAVRPR